MLWTKYDDKAHKLSQNYWLVRQAWKTGLSKFSNIHVFHFVDFVMVWMY